MRNDLEYLAEIEAYLMKTLTQDQQIEFEARIKREERLRRDVYIMKNLITGIKAQTLRKEVNQAGKSYFLTKRLTWLLIGLITLAIIAASAHFKGNQSKKATENLPQPTIAIEKPKQQDATPKKQPALEPQKQDDTSPSKSNAVGAIKHYGSLSAPPSPQAETVRITDEIEVAGKALSELTYKVNGSKNELIETPHGILFSIPKGSFQDKNGNTVTDTYEIQIKEATQALDIMKAGLSTFSNGKLLETGGMFYFNATKDGESLTIKTDAAITVSVPKLYADNKGMSLYEAQKKSNGEINWVNPKPPLEYLETTPMTKLNFYPPRYESMLNELGISNATKAFKDSVYMSFSAYLGVQQNIRPATSEQRKQYKNIDLGFFQIPIKRLADKTYEKPADTITNVQLGIDPISVLSFWNAAFDGSILATKEFEQRMRIIHTTCSEDILNCYINNLDKSLYYCDSLAVKKITNGKTREAFLNFYYQKNQKVPVKSQFTEELLAMYAQKQKELNDLFETTSLITWQNIQAQKNELAEKNKGYIAQEINKSKDTLQKTLCAANKMLNKPCPTLVSPVAVFNYNNFSITTTGWHNVDRPITTLTQVNSFSEKQLREGNETDFMVAFKDDKFDLVEAYLIPEGKYSFLRMKKQTTSFISKFVYPMKYNMIVVGYKNDQPFSHIFENVKPNTRYEAHLQPTAGADIQAFLSNNEISNEVISEISDLVAKAQATGTAKRYKNTEELVQKLTPIIFPCASVEGNKKYVNDKGIRKQ